MNWQARIRQAFHPRVLDDDVVEELAQHLEAAYASARAEGASPDAAERVVDRQCAAWVASPDLLRRRPRRPSVVPPPSSTSTRGLGSILQDARYAGRLLRRQPAYAALVILTMGLGIAATTVLGSVSYGVTLKPLPWADAPRMVRLYETRQGSTRRFRPMMANGTYLEWRRSMTTLDALGAWTGWQGTLDGNGGAERIRIAGVTPELFPMLNAAPALGRLFVDGEGASGTPPIIILSHGLWRERFGGEAGAIGQTLKLDATSYTVVGVMPASFAFPDRVTRAWTPFHVPPVSVPGKPGFSISMFQALGRLRDGATPQQAAAEGTARGRAGPSPSVVTMAVFGSNGPVEVTAVPLLEALTGEVKPAILILMAAVGLLLGTAVANVASLQLARASARRRELAIRAALGAGRGRLVRQTLVENLVLGLLGGAAGLALAAVLHRALPAILPADFPRLDDLAFDIRIQVFAVAVSLAAGLGCGLLPALHAARADVVPALVEDSLAPVGGGLRSRTARTRAAIMIGQIAIACVLLVGAALLIRSFSAMLRADVGYDGANVLTARIVMPNGAYSPARRSEVLDAIAARMTSTPGVAGVSFSSNMPFASGLTLASFPLKKRDGSTEQIQSGNRIVGAGYFAALGQRVVEGREFVAGDGAGEGAVIVNREFSRRYLEGRAMGWTLPGQKSPRPIVGVVEDTARQSITDTPQPEMFMAMEGRSLSDAEIFVVVRASADPRALAPALREIVKQHAPGAPLESVMTMDDRLAETLARPRLYAVLLGAFAVLALIIAGVGLFGVLSYTVAQRAREIGVRTALGAQMRDVIVLILVQALTIAGAGLAIGLAASFWLTSTLRTFLYGITAHDPLSYTIVALVLLTVALAATIVPARRAARVDPVRVLRG